MSEIFDLGIIGGGPAGYNSAEKAGHRGLKTVIFENQPHWTVFV